jgi:hypothetical protein
MATVGNAQPGTPIVPSSGEALVINGSYVAPTWLRFFNNLVGSSSSGGSQTSQIGVTIQAYDPQLSSLIRQNKQSADYTLALTDDAKHIYHAPTDTAVRTWTIPSNASVPFPVGSVVTFDNDFGAGTVTITIGSTDTLVLVGTAGTTGSRTLASGGQATALKVAPTRWRISGVGIT